MLKYSILLFAARSLLALTTFNVVLDTDNNPGGNGEINDLRYALNSMNESLNTTPDDYAITFAFPMTIQLNGILPIINNSSNPVNITIGNSGSIPNVTIDGNMGSYGGFFIPMGNVTIQNMIFQNLTAKGGDGGNGISGGGGGLGAGGAIYVPSSFLYGSNPSVTLMNVSINYCSAVGGNGGSYLGGSPTGNEGGGGGGGFAGNGGSVTTTGSTGGGGGGGFGGNGGDVTFASGDALGGGGGGGGGIGSRANMGTPTNLGNGGSDQEAGLSGNAYGLATTAGSGGGGLTGGTRCGGGGGGAPVGLTSSGGGGGGSAGTDGLPPKGEIPPGGGAAPSGGLGGDGGGGGGGGVVVTDTTNSVDGMAGNGGHGGGGGGGAGTGSSSTDYTVEGGSGGFGGGGGGGGVNISGSTTARGGDSLGGGGGGGGGPSNGLNAPGGTDGGHLGGGAGGFGANDVSPGSGGGGGGGGSGLGGAIFVGNGLNLTIQALSGTPTSFNTSNNTVQAGSGGIGGPNASDGFDGTALGPSIFLSANSSLTLTAYSAGDLLTLGEGVSFTDDTDLGGMGSHILVTGNGTVVYEGTSNYRGTILINNTNFKVNGTIAQSDVSVCRNVGFSPQRGTLSGIGTLTGSIFVNSGIISPDNGGTLTLGSLTLSSADPVNNTLGSLVHIEIDSSGTSLVSVTGTATLAGILEIDLNANTLPGTYTVLTASSITGHFDSVSFTGTTPSYTLSYLPSGAPTFVQFEFLGASPSFQTLSTQGLKGNELRVANYLNRLAPDAGALGLTAQFALLNSLSFPQYANALGAISPARNSASVFAAQNMLFTFSNSLTSHFTNRRLASQSSSTRSIKETAFLADNELLATSQSPRKTIHAPPKNTNSQIWATGFGGFSRQSAQNQNPSFHFNSGGFFVAYDYGNPKQGCIGALAGYAHSSIEQNQSMGNAHIDAGYLSVYGTSFLSNFFIDAAIWGEYMGVSQNRTISFPGFAKTASSSYHAEQFDLHFGTGYDLDMSSATIEPFGLLDWAVEWDPNYTEKGAFPYNMNVSSRTSWMLRCETGLNGYKTTTCSWGVFIAQAKLSYVYKKPHNVGSLNAAIVGAPSSFNVEAFTSGQNLFSPAIELFWQTNWNGYGCISYDGEFGSGYISNQIYGKLGYSF